MPPENVLTWSFRRSQSSNNFSSCFDALDAHLARNIVEHGVQFHVLVGGLLAVEAGILEDDAEPFAGLRFCGSCGSSPSSSIFPLVG